MTRPLKIFIVAGEASGDALGASLMRALKDAHPHIAFTGIGGSRMVEEGLSPLFPMEELAVMGFAEVLPKIVTIFARMRQTVRAVVAQKPDALITIDAPDFCFRVTSRVKAQAPDIPCIHYVAPSVWAWRPGRAEKVSKFLDHILTLLPFEPSYFTAHGLKATFVGHPIVERAGRSGDGARFRRRHSVRPYQPVVSFLPGSRTGEVARHLSPLGEAATMVLHRYPEAVIVIPTLPHLKPQIDAFFEGKGINPIVVATEEEKFDCFSASAAAVAASGTVSLELALTDTPHIVAYRVNAITAYLASRLVKTPYVNLINIILRRKVVPELLQDDCEPKRMADEAMKLIGDKDLRAAQLTDFREALIRVGLGDIETPSQKAAATVLRTIADKGQPL